MSARPAWLPCLLLGAMLAACQTFEPLDKYGKNDNAAKASGGEATWSLAAAPPPKAEAPTPKSEPAQALRQPPPPYYSVEVKTVSGEEAARDALASYANEPFARAEPRRSGYILRVGAWPTREEAERAMTDLQGRGLAATRVIRLKNPVAWLLPGGETLAVPGAEPPAPAAAAPAPAVTPPPATAAPPPAAAAASGAPAPAAAPAPLPAAPEENGRLSQAFRAAAAELDAAVRKRITSAGVTRSDGYVYALDVGPLLLYAAQRGDAALYQQLWPAAQALIQSDPSDPFTEGFVVWRHRAGAKAEVSGTAEALWMARALWAGAETFKRSGDKTLAKKVLDGYTRHAYELQGVWLARRWFSFGDRVFAGESVLPDYHPDFMAQVEKAFAEKAEKAEKASARAEKAPSQAGLRGFADRSYALLKRAETPAHLLYPMIQPELGATYPGTGVELYAPNGIASLEDSCLGAEGAASGAPQLAAGILEFIADKAHRDADGGLYAYYDAEDGTPAGRQPLAASGYACLGRLAAGQGAAGTMKLLDPLITANLRAVAQVPARHEMALHLAAQLLLAAQALGAF